MMHMNQAIDEVRAGEARELVRQGYEPVLKKSRWLLLKRPENLKDSQQASLAELLQYNLKSVKSYLLKEQFQCFWEYISPHWAGLFLDTWCTKVLRSRLAANYVCRNSTDENKNEKQKDTIHAISLVIIGSYGKFQTLLILSAYPELLGSFYNL